jgi:hypothetical protein
LLEDAKKTYVDFSKNNYLEEGLDKIMIYYTIPNLEYEKYAIAALEERRIGIKEGTIEAAFPYRKIYKDDSAEGWDRKEVPEKPMPLAHHNSQKPHYHNSAQNTQDAVDVPNLHGFNKQERPTFFKSQSAKEETKAEPIVSP